MGRRLQAPNRESARAHALSREGAGGIQVLEGSVSDGLRGGGNRFGLLRYGRFVRLRKGTLRIVAGNRRAPAVSRGKEPAGRHRGGPRSLLPAAGGACDSAPGPASCRSVGQGVIDVMI